jgi:SAM-dependent methyltransferase
MNGPAAPPPPSDRAVDLEFHNRRERTGGEGNYGAWMKINCVIDPRDDIFKFFASHPLAANPVREYLSDGWRSLSELIIAMESADRSLLKCRSVLEFASGFGRFTRHLVRALPGRITCSDVQPGSVDFTRDELGAPGFYSTSNAQSLRIPGQYDLVFILSLFTHLPPDAWGPWLQKLFAAVAPGGALIFSVHNEARGIELGVNFDAAGTHFIASSESPQLGGETYGTTFTTRGFVEREVAAALPGNKVDYREIAFWDGQDAVIVGKPL